MRDTLAACGLLPREIFQLAAIAYPRVKVNPLVAHAFPNTEAGVKEATAWAGEWEGKRNLYVCGNPLKTLKHRKALDTDVSVVRCLLLDVDPVAPDYGKDCLLLCRGAQDLLKNGTVVFSGRGCQLWITHEEELTSARSLILEGIRQRFVSAHTKIDATHDPSRLMRLPGYTNLKTGEKARIL